MGTAVRALLPLGVALALSPLPVAAAILMLLTPRPLGSGVGFLLGWTGGIVLATGTSALAAEAGNLDGARASTAASWLQLAVGVLLGAAGVVHWIRRPGPGEPARHHGWMAVIGTLTPARGTALGLVLCCASPKNLTLCVTAGISVAGRDLPGGQPIFVVLVFTGIAASTVAVPVVGHALGAERMRHPLERARVLLHRVSGTWLAALAVALGALLAGTAVTGLR
jgi:hypothetical protein